VAAEQPDLNPYVGPRPFEPTTEDRRRFYGRDREVDEIVSLVLSHPLVLVYAQSGAGKTSMFNAAITPALERKRFTVLPLARVRAAVPEGLDGAAISNLYSFCALLSLEPGEDPRALARRSLSEVVSGEPGAPQRDAPRAIVFDQLEEVFTFEKVLELYPQRWQEQQEQFFREVAATLADDPLLRVVFVIRKEFLAELNRFARLLPEDLQTQFRLEPLDAAAALQAVKRPLEGTPRSFADGVAEDLVERLLTESVEVAPGKTLAVRGRFVEPVQLQLVCRRLWRELPASTAEITSEHVLAFGDVDRVLGQFYDGAVRAAAAAARTSEGKLRKRIEDDFITSVGTRGTVYRSEWEGLGTALDTLEERRLVRSEFRGTQWYELTHDRLIEPVRRSNAEYFAERTRRRLRLVTGALPVAVVLAAILIPFFALRHSRAPTARASAAAAALSSAQQRLNLSQRLAAVPATSVNGFAEPGNQEIRAVAAVQTPPFPASRWGSTGRAPRSGPTTRPAGGESPGASAGAGSRASRSSGRRSSSSDVKVPTIRSVPPRTRRCGPSRTAAGVTCAPRARAAARVQEERRSARRSGASPPGAAGASPERSRSGTTRRRIRATTCTSTVPSGSPATASAGIAPFSARPLRDPAIRRSGPSSPSGPPSSPPAGTAWTPRSGGRSTAASTGSRFRARPSTSATGRSRSWDWLITGTGS
jgi:hypothetical protein